MDSMRSLNSSLPRNSPPKQQGGGETPEQLLQAFKSAALSVTTLYKTAAHEQAKSRSEGYQDALDELLSFMDKGNIGLDDGEGWRIRQWATERLNGREPAPQESDEESDKADRGASPNLQRQSSNTEMRTESDSEPYIETVTHDAPAASEPVTFLPPSGNFTFRSAHSYPQPADMNLDDLHLSDVHRHRSQSQERLGSTQHGQGVPIAATPRSSRNRHNNNHTSRMNTRASSNANRQLTGSKRKMDIGDFFDLGNLGSNGKDFFDRGGKRGRHA